MSEWLLRKWLFFWIYLFLLFFLGSDALAQNNKIDSISALMGSPFADTLSAESGMKNYLTLSSAFNQSDPSRSLDYGRKALHYSIKANNRRGEAMAYNMLGIAHYVGSGYDSARYHYDLALAVFTEIKDTLGIVHTLNNTGILLKSTGNYDASIRNYSLVLEIAEKKSQKDMMAYTLNNIAIVYYDWKHFEPALEHYRLALGHLRDLGDSTRMAALLNNIGELFRETGVFDSAYIYFNEALKISLTRNLPKTQANAYINLGDLKQIEKSYQDALVHYGKARETANSGMVLPALAISSVRIGNVYLETGDFDKANQFITEGLSEANKLKDPKIMQEANLAAYTLFYKSGNSSRALDHYIKYTQLKDSLFNLNSQKEIDRLRTEYETGKKENEIILLSRDKALQELEIERQKNLRMYTTLAALLIVVILYLLYTRYKQRQKLLKEQLERSRADIEQRLLRSQMNPHFLFNSLNTINGFIMSNNVDTASEFLTKFSKLVRHILEYSRKEMILLDEEVKTLRLYLELERMRFNNRFDFDIEVSGDLKTDELYVPPMLTQPFIENALIHGLFPKQEGGTVKIYFSADKAGIKVEIIDNGIGREAAGAMSRKQTDIHRSLGLQLTRERLALMDKNKENRYCFTFTDLYDNKGTAAGTKVELLMPCEEE
jgi:tetratricopeptide (TPR) repeat protein